MTIPADQLGETESPEEGLIFLPGAREGIVISSNYLSDFSRIEYAIMTGRGVFGAIRRDLRGTETLHNAFLAEKARFLGDRALASISEM